MFSLGTASAGLYGATARAEDGGHIRMRAREHFEELTLHAAGEQSYFRGFTNTIDLWYERPFHYAIGLAGSPLFAFLHGNNPPPGYGAELRLVHLGGEAKWFPAASLVPVYTRLGCFQAELTSNGSAGTLRGTSELVGLGYEFDLGGLGLAPEMEWRSVQLSRHVWAFGIAPSLGLHFYKAM